MREHGTALIREQLSKVAEGALTLSTRNLGSLRGLDNAGMSWHLTVAAHGGSRLAMPERWIDRFTSSYLLLAALAAPWPKWMEIDEGKAFVKKAYALIVVSLSSLGLTRLAMLHCPRPPGCAQPEPPASRLVPLSDASVDNPELWYWAALLALQCGERADASATINTALNWAERRSDFRWAIEFRLERAQWLLAENQRSEADAEWRGCRELISRITDDEQRRLLSEKIDQLGAMLEPDDLRRHERDVLQLRGSVSLAVANESEIQISQLITLAHRYLGFGRLTEARGVADRASQLAKVIGVQLLEQRAAIAQAQVTFALGNKAEAILILENWLATAGQTVEADLSDTGMLLGLLGLFRTTHIQSLALPADEAAKLPELAQAISELERSMAIHIRMGAWRDVMVNLINLSLAHFLQTNFASQLRSLLDALRLCMDFMSDAPPFVRYPKSCLTIWTNLAGTCKILRWYPEAPVISRYCLTTLIDLTSGLVSFDNQLRPIPYHEYLVQQAIQTIWEWIRDPNIGAIDAQQTGTFWNELRGLRSELRHVCMQSGMTFDPSTYPLPTGSDPEPRISEIRVRGESSQSIWRSPILDSKPDAAAQIDRQEQLRRELLELIEEGKARILREQLGSVLPVPETVPVELREREERAHGNWLSAREKCNETANPPELKRLINDCSARYRDLLAIWSEMETFGGIAAEYSRLRSGRSANFQMILDCL
jgi:hypothetical protein